MMQRANESFADAFNRVEEVAKLTNQRASLIAYLRAKIDVNDWHAVQDAASDIREIEAALKVLHA